MHQRKFRELMDNLNTAWVYYKRADGKPTFNVCTTDFSDHYISKIMEANTKRFGSPYPETKKGFVTVFSYSKNKFRQIEANRITGVRGLSSVLRN